MKILILILIFLPGLLFAQSDSVFNHYSVEIQQLLEDSFGLGEDPANYDYIEELLANPINLNSAAAGDFEALPFMDKNSANLIIDHRKEFGKFLSKNELRLINNLDQTKVELLLIFTTTDEPQIAEIEDRNLLSDLKINLRSRIFRDIQARKGFINSAYAGSPLKNYSRFKLSSGNNFSAGALIEKDAGENNLTDHSSFFVNLKDVIIFNQLTAGDYTIEFGSGAAIWSAYKLSKGSNVLAPIRRKGRNLIPYSSTNENNYLRGGAASLNIGILNLTAFYSNHKIDANLDSSGNILSFPEDGFHRTQFEIQKRKTISEVIYGAKFDFNLFSNFNLSGLYFNSNYSGSILQKTIFSAGGMNFNNYSLAYSYVLPRISVAGEFAYNSISVASVNSMEISLTPKIVFIASLRNFPRNYFSLKSNAFSESSNNQNEFGFYTGMIYRSIIGNFSIFYDQYKFPSMTLNNPLSGKGNEIMLYWTNRWSRSVSTNFKYSFEKKDISDNSGDIAEIIQAVKNKIRTDLIFNLSKNLRWKMRYEYAGYNNRFSGNENGFLTYQDFRIQINSNLTAYSRIIFFATDSYNSRIYEFENDLRGMLSNPPLYGEGIKLYLVMSYEFFNNCILSAKFSRLSKPAESTIGTANQTIYSSIYEYFSVQLEINF